MTNEAEAPSETSDLPEMAESAIKVVEAEAAQDVPPAVEASSAPVAEAAPVTAAKAAKPKVARRKAPVPKAPEPAREVKPAPVRARRKPAVRASAKTKVPSTPAPRKSAAKPVRAPIKEKTMAKTTSTDFLASIQSAFAEMQDKAKTAYDKSTAAFGDANDFAKGNVEAVVESGKILASGLQEMGSSLLTEGRSAFDTMTAEVKELAAVKSPTEFFSLQSQLTRKNFDMAVAQASKNTEAMLKLFNDVVTPISGRVTLAVEKVSKAA